MERPADHPDIATDGVGVLLVNLGTPDAPDAPDAPALRRYLAEFLSDRRVIEAPRWLWKPILHGIVLRTRPRKSAEAYAKIWRDDGEGSPLSHFTRAQAAALDGRLGSGSVAVDWAMRYGRPSIAEGLDRLIARGCRRILLAPLYPQYSAATTASVQDTAFAHLATLRWQPALRTLPTYHDDPAYIAALADRVRGELGAGADPDAAEAPEMLLCSFHGMPAETLRKGDPYHCFCQKTGRLLREALGWPTDRFRVVFQSRFGPAEWLRPYADETVAELAGRGVERLAILSPGFAVDCVETLEEIDIGLRETFMTGGGESFRYIPCLNDTAGGLDMLETLIRRELSGWI